MNPYLAPAPTAAQGTADPYASPPAGGYGSPPLGGYGPTTNQRVEVSDASVDMLRQTRPWVLFLSVMSFIGAGLTFLGGIAVMVFSGLAPTGSTMPSAALGAIYLPFSLLYIYPGLKLWSFASAIGRLVTSRSNIDLDAALTQQKSFWKYAGIATIVTIALYSIFFVGMIAVGVAAGLRH